MIFLLITSIFILLNIQITYQHNLLNDSSVKDFSREIRKIREHVYHKYPKKFDKDERYPPPKGSYMEYFTVDTTQLIPKEYYTITTDVHVLVSTKRVVKMDIEQQSLILAVRETLTWRDKSLRWKLNFANHSTPVHSMIFKRDSVWTPPVFPYNILKEEQIRDWTDVYSWNTGSAYMERTVQYTIPCTVNVREFPFDIHNCTLILGQPFQYHSRINFQEVTETLSQDTRDNYIYSHDGEHLEWELVNWTDKVMISDHQYPHMSRFIYTLHLRRRATFYFTVLILPCIVLNLLSLTVFTLSVVDTGRMDFCLALILTYFVLIMIVVDSSPPSGNQIPLLGLYIILSTGVVAISFGMSMILVEIHEHCRLKEKRMSKYLSNVLEKYCCLYKRFEKYKMQIRRNSNDDANDGVNESIPLCNTFNKKDDKDLLEVFKWKLLGKVLNLIFCTLVILAHIIIPMIIFLGSNNTATEKDCH